MLGSQKRKDMLLESFRLLKDNPIANRNELPSIIGQMADIDTARAVEMWRSLIKSNEAQLKQEPSISHTTAESFVPSTLLNNVYDELFSKDSFGEIESVVLSDTYLSEMLFGYTDYVFQGIARTACMPIKNGDLSKAGRFFSLIHDNRNAKANRPFSATLRDLMRDGLYMEARMGSRGRAWGRRRNFDGYDGDSEERRFLQNWIDIAEADNEREERRNMIKSKQDLMVYLDEVCSSSRLK